MMNQNKALQPSTTENASYEMEVSNDQPPKRDGEVEYQQSYDDPNQFQNYYYEPADGNYYYYPTQDANANEAVEDTGEVPLTAENLIRSYEFEDWEPRSYNWFADIVLETFMSIGFRLYLFFLFYCAGALIFVVSLNWTFEILFRMYAPLPKENSNSWIIVSFIVMFFFLSFTLVTVFCTWIDMLKCLRYVKREDTSFWGISHYSKQKPPFILYFIIIILTTIFPIFWGIIDAAVNNQSLIFFAQTYAYISVIVTSCIIAICYVWFYWKALKRKRTTFIQRLKRDEFWLWEKTSRHKTLKPIKKRWYHASTVLEEYGLDGSTLRWNAVVFTVGCVPLFGLYTSQALRTYIGDPQITWGAISSVSLTCVYIIAWVTLFRTRAHWSIYLSLILLIFTLIFGIIAGAVAQSKEAAILTIVLFISSHGMLARKRPHKLTRREQCSLFQITLDPEIQHDVQRRRYDTHLLCCRDAILSCLKCFDVKTFFGYRHPDIIRAELQYELENLTIITDQKILMYWWIIVMFALAFVIAIGNVMIYNFSDNIATKGLPTTAQNSNFSLCHLVYNINGSAPLKIYDLSLLSALSYTVGTNGNKDFVTWFSHLPNLVRQYPLRLPPNFDYATDGVIIPFSDYVDLISNYHFITLNANNRGMSLMRSIDEWGTSISIQVAGVISPLINAWPEKYRTSFIYGVSFLQRWFSRSDVLKDVSLYIENLIALGKKDNILLIGDQFNGGYAKILSSIYDISFVAFNPPGTKYKISMPVKGVQVAFTRGILSYVDSLEDTLETVYLYCDPHYSSNRCSRIETTIEAMRDICGDHYGRYIK